jgi:hypothetical protein
MGCSNSSFEINKSKDNIQEEIRDDDIIELMKKRLEENKDKEIANHDLIKIKLLGDDLDENNNKDKINEENKDENNYELNKILLGKNKEKNNMFSEVENNKANKYYNDEDTHNDKKNKDKNKDNYMMNNDNKNNIDGQDEIMMNNDTSNFFSHNASKNNISIIDKYFKTKKLKKSIFNKTRLNDNISKEPFTLKTIKNESINISTLQLNAPYFLREYLIPIWFKKNEFIKFTTSGKWRIDKTYDFTDTKGMPTPNTLDFNYGACIARIGSSSPFVILPNEFTYITKNEGPLYLRMNLPRKLKLSPEGKIEMNIYDGEVLPIEEIYERIGWKENNTKYGNDKGTKMENELMSAINNLRMNPVLFYDKYFRDIQNIVWIEKYLQEKEFNNKNKINGKPFLANDNCYDVLDNYVNNNYVNQTSINRQKVSLYLNEMKDNLELYANEELKYKNLINCKLTQKYKVNDICFQYLLDKKFRNDIFSNEYNYITAKIVQNYIDESSLIIICLSYIEDNNENENIN